MHRGYILTCSGRVYIYMSMYIACGHTCGLNHRTNQRRYMYVHGSAHRDLSGSFSSSKEEPLFCNQSAFGLAFPTFYSIVSGSQNSLCGGKRRLSGG